ncbi:MAG: hypothetical protein CL843_15610 [Crocinitomicaceae bacterium]|nr:hypothetical protein [Crocinitomicaceae bacterium]|tara:strand:+ start:75 stop:1202 length:1128 start_codon:yes stop_codon:yes gene_type:complete
MHLLFHRYTPWQRHIRCSTNIYAEKAIENGVDVSYMSGITNPLKLARNRKIEKINFRKSAYNFTPFTLIPFTKGAPFNHQVFADLSYTSFLPSISSILDKGYGDPDVIWTVPPGSSGLQKNFSNVPLIMQVVDYYPAFLGEGIKKIEKKDYSRADHIFTIGGAMSAYLINDLKVNPNKITSLGQGVDIEKYKKEYSIPNDIAELPDPIAIWVGVVNKGDQPMFEKVAAHMDKIGGSFVIIGPETEWARSMAARFENCKCLGPKMSDEIPAYLLNSDIGIMLYNRNKLAIYKGQHPLKLYEYAAAGLSIISTHHEEYNYLDKPPLYVINNENEVDDSIDWALANRNEKKQNAIAFAEKHTWDNAFDKALSIINKIK